ncbi:MAG: hypothetical protein K2N60_13260, partial [Oscillospiraceae bacterium]|nr:hypothetical protein [Oscillospiraceae bacterium]
MQRKTRDESISDLSEMLSKEQLHKAVTRGYSDVSLAVISHFKSEYAAMFFDSQYSSRTVNKLIGAYLDDKIDPNDLIQALKYSEHNKKNEPYLDDFIDSIDNGFYHATAAKTFTAVMCENCSYKEAVELVMSGAFYPTEYANLSITNNVAEQLDQMGVPLRACEGFNYCYDIDSADRLKGALERGAAIFVQDKELAVKVCEYMKLPDWSNFRSQVEFEMGSDIVNLSGYKLSGLRKKYLQENRSIELSQKINDEYIKFIADMKKEPAENIIQSAYEIVWKDSIATYCEEYPLNLSE